MKNVVNPNTEISTYIRNFKIFSTDKIKLVINETR